MYLGLLIGEDVRRMIFWVPLLDPIKARLLGWKSKFLSFRSHLIGGWTHIWWFDVAKL